MVNVTIYLKKEHPPKELIKYLLSLKLIASASIDGNKTSYTLTDGALVGDVFNVITAQTKSLLLNDIIKVVRDKTGTETPITSTPIIGTNQIFIDAIRSKTIPT